MRLLRFRPTLLLLLSVACDGAGSSGSHDVDDLPQLGVAEERRIGSVDDPETGFSRLFDVDVDRHGRVYALESLDNEIRVYDADGRVVRRIGGRGAGPGEFENAPFFGVIGDTLWTYDGRSGRITLFDSAGALLASGRTTGLRVPIHRGYGYVMPERMREDGRLLGWFMRVAYSRQDTATGVAETDSIPVPRVLFDISGAVVDTLAVMPAPPPRMVPPPGYDRPTQWITHAGGRHVVPSPPTELPTWLPADDGHYVVDVPYIRSPGRFTVTRIDLAGDTVWHRVLTYTPEPYTDADLDAAARRPMFAPVSGPAPEPDDALANALRAALEFPDFRNPIERAWLADDGAVWLARTGASDGTARWIVLRPDGVVRGEVQVPENARPLWSRGDTLWANVPDAMDVPWLVRYRIGQ